MEGQVFEQYEIDPRTIEMQAKSTIRHNLIMALVELVTNTDDSYRRIEQSSEASGNILIEIDRSQRTLVVKDFAKGFDKRTMQERIKRYGGDTSGFDITNTGRGFWGRGLKEAIIGLGEAIIESVKGNYYYRCIVKPDGFKVFDPQVASNKIRRASGMKENGTLIQITVTNKKVPFLHFDTLSRQLSLHYSLRDIFTNPKRNVILQERKKGRVVRKKDIVYNFPVSELHLEKTIEIDGFDDATVDLVLFRADDELSGYRDEGMSRQSGILIKSDGAIVDCTLTSKFEESKHARHLYGFATCRYIDTLMRSEREPIVRSDRGGLDPHHPFVKALDRSLSIEIEKFVNSEEKREKATKQRVENEKTRKRFQAALREINSIAKDELGELDGDGPGEGHGKYKAMPENGFDFIPDMSEIVIQRVSTLTLKAILSDKIKEGSVIRLKSSSDYVDLLTNEILIGRDSIDETSGLVVTRVKVIGNRVGEEAFVTAETDDLKAEALVKVVSRRIRTEKPTQQRKRGLFKDYKFDPSAEPAVRVRFNRASGIIEIATKAPSVMMYFGPNGEKQEEGPCQVMLAELVVDAVCREIARRTIESDADQFPGDPAEAMISIHNKLIRKYAAKIHSLLVERKFVRSSKL